MVHVLRIASLLCLSSTRGVLSSFHHKRPPAFRERQINLRLTAVSCLHCHVSAVWSPPSPLRALNTTWNQPRIYKGERLSIGSSAVSWLRPNPEVAAVCAVSLEVMFLLSPLPSDSVFLGEGWNSAWKELLTAPLHNLIRSKLHLTDTDVLKKKKEKVTYSQKTVLFFSERLFKYQ